MRVSADSKRSLLGIDEGTSVPVEPNPGEEREWGSSFTALPSPDEEEVEEGRAPKTRECPPSMNAEELRTHSLTHISYHPGCRCYVAARKRDHKHPRRQSNGAEIRADDEATPHAAICADYFFPRDSRGSESVTALAICDATSQFLAAHIVDAKGASANSAIRQVLRDLRKMGHYGDVKVRIDQESSLSDLFRAVAKERGSARTVLTLSLIHI